MEHYYGAQARRDRLWGGQARWDRLWGAKHGGTGFGGPPSTAGLDRKASTEAKIRAPRTIVGAQAQSFIHIRTRGSILPVISCYIFWLFKLFSVSWDVHLLPVVGCSLLFHFCSFCLFFRMFYLLHHFFFPICCFLLMFGTFLSTFCLLLSFLLFLFVGILHFFPHCQTGLTDLLVSVC